MRSQEMQSKVEVAVVAGLVRGPALLAAAGRAEGTRAARRAGAQPLVWWRPGAKGKRGAIAHDESAKTQKDRQLKGRGNVAERAANISPPLVQKRRRL